MKQVVTHVVVRPLEVAGTNLMPGDRVDASGWKNTEKLVSAQFLRVATEVDRKAGPPKAAAAPPPTPPRAFKLKKAR